MRKILATTLILLPAAAFAEGELWLGKESARMHPDHLKLAKAARVVADELGPDGFGTEPHGANWTWQGCRNLETPMSNMTAEALETLLVGHYMLTEDTGGPYWTVAYAAPDGRTHICRAQENGTGEEYVQDRCVTRSTFGLAGYYLMKPGKLASEGNDWAFPFVADSASGRIGNYYRIEDA